MKIIFNKFPTTTAHISRLQIFQPTRRPIWQERSIDNVYGTATIIGKLGQVHADIMEAIFWHGHNHQTTEAGNLQILVDPYKVRTTIGGLHPYSHDTLRRMLSELQEAAITAEVPSLGLKIKGGLIDRIEESSALWINRATGSPRKQWFVTLGPAIASILRVDLPLHYDPTLLVQLETGIAQATARYILAHQQQPEGGWEIDNLIQVVGAKTEGTALRNRRRELHASAERLKIVDVVIDGNRIFRKTNTTLQARVGTH